MLRVHLRPFKLEYLEMGPDHKYFLKGLQLILQLGLINTCIKSVSFHVYFS